MKSNIKKICISALFAALTFVATFVVQIPAPFGYVNLGDCFVLLCGVGKSKWQKILFGICGLLLCHAVGVLQYMVLSHLGIWAAFIAVSLPFILKDIILVVCALAVSEIMEKRIIK